MNEDLINRITYYLSSGGLFNPELADHLAVRNLLMECRDALAQPEHIQVSPLEFVEMVMEKEHLIGNPIFWAEWPNKEENT